MKIFVNGTKYLSIILLLTGLTVRVAGDGDCDNVNITGIIEEQDKEEMDLMKDAFWSLGGKPYPNMQNPTVAYVHFAHCRKIQKDKIYEKSNEDYKKNTIETFNEFKRAYQDNRSKENKKAFKAQKNIKKAVKARIEMEKKHFEHCDELLIKTERSEFTTKVLAQLAETNDWDKTKKKNYCLNKFNISLSTKYGWYFGYFYYFYYTFSLSQSSIEKTSIESIAANNFGKYIMEKEKEGLELQYERQMNADSVGELNTYAYYCQKE